MFRSSIRPSCDRRPSAATLIIAVPLALVVLTTIPTPSHAQDTSVPCADCDYVIDGTWMADRAPDDTALQVARFAGIGGRIILRFGYKLRSSTPSELAARLAELGCPTCVADAESDLAAAGVNIVHWAHFGELVAGQVGKQRHFGAALRCSDAGQGRPLEAQVTHGTRVFTRTVVPADSDSPACVGTGAGNYAIVFTWYDTGYQDPDAVLLRHAQERGLTVYLGAPVIPHLWSPALGRTIVDPQLRHVGRAFNRRFYADAAARYAAYGDSLAGVYQSMEVDLSGHFAEGGASAELREEYSADARAFHAQMEGRAYVISPYMTSRVSPTASIQQLVRGFRELARAGVDVIAPQDGRGTGKVGLFWDWQSHLLVSTTDPLRARYGDLLPTATNRDTWFASSGDLYDALEAAARELNLAGRPVALWANLEAFENPSDPTDVFACGSRSDRYKTTKQRLDLAVAVAGGNRLSDTNRTRISYMWDPFFIESCQPASPVRSTLYDEIVADHQRPIVFDAHVESGHLVVHGHHIAVQEVSFGTSDYAPHRGLTGYTPAILERTRDPRSNDRVILEIRPGALDSVWTTVRAYRSDGRRSDEFRVPLRPSGL